MECLPKQYCTDPSALPDIGRLFGNDDDKNNDMKGIMGEVDEKKKLKKHEERGKIEEGGR